MSLNRKMRRQAQRASEKNANVFKRSRFNEQPENGQEDESFIKNMLGSISKSPFMKKVLLNAIGLTLMAAPAGYADSQIIGIGQTGTNIHNKGHIFTIQATGDNIKGSYDLNTFSKFTLDKDDVANFIANKQNGNILNFVNEKVNINGIVNAIHTIQKNGENKREIGGNLYFLSSDGIVIGSTGVVNAGSFYAIVPSKGFMESVINFTSGTLTEIGSNKISGILKREGITLTGEGKIEIKGTIRAKNQIGLLAGRTFDDNKKSVNDATNIIIGPSANLTTYADYATFESALNLSDTDKQNWNLDFAADENDSFGGNITIASVGHQGEDDLNKTGYAAGIKTEGTINSSGIVELVTDVETANAKATNHVSLGGSLDGSLGGSITANGGIRVNSNEILDANDKQKNLTANGSLSADDQIGVNLQADKIELSNAKIKGTNGAVKIGQLSHSQTMDAHVSVNVGGNIEGSSVNVYANSGIQLENVKANGGIDIYDSATLGEIKLINYRNETANEGKIKVTGTLKSNGYVNNGTQTEPNNVPTENSGKITVDNGVYEQNSTDTFGPVYNAYTRLEGKSANVELNEVYGGQVSVRGYDVSANVVKTTGKTEIAAGGALTVGEENAQVPVVVGQDALTVAATSINAKGDIEAGSVNMQSYNGATLKGVKAVNGNIGINNKAETGAVIIDGNVVANKDNETKGNIGIYNITESWNNNSTGGKITINGDVEGNEVKIHAGDDIRVNNVDAEAGTLSISGKNVTVAENKNLNADNSISITAREAIDSKNSAINAGTSINIEAESIEVKTTTSGESTNLRATNSIIAHGKLLAGYNLELGKEWQIVDNGTQKVVGTGYTNSITLEDDTVSGYGYVEPPQQSLAAIEGLNFSAGGTDYYGTDIKGKTINAAVNQGTTIKSKGDIRIWGGTVALNNTESLGEGYIQGSPYETVINADDITANSITAVGGVDIDFRNEATITQKVESQNWSVSIDADRDSNFAESKATITGASAHGRIGITAGTVNLNNAQAQLIRVTANKGGTLSNLTTLGNDAVERETIGSDFGEAKIGGGRNTYSTYRGIYVDNIEYKAITGYEEDGYTPIYETTVPTGNFTLAGTITAKNGGVYVYNDGNDIVLGNGNSAANITGQGMSLYTQGNITDNSGNNQLTTVGDSGSLGFRAIGGVNLANTAINASGWFEVNNGFNNNAQVTITKGITAKHVAIAANKGITVGNITANAGNIKLDNTSTEATGHIVVNGNLTATIDPEDPEGKTGEIEISNGYWGSSSSDNEDGAAAVRNVTMQDATAKKITINTSSELKAGALTSTWAEQNPTRMESRIKYKLDENGQRVKDENGHYIIETDEKGEYVFEDVEVENWDRTGITVGAAEVAIGNIKSNNGVSLQNRKIAVGDVEGTNITLVANEGIEAGNITVNGTKDAYGVVISNENRYHYVEPTEIEGGNGSLRKGSSENRSLTYTPPTGTVKVLSVKFALYYIGRNGERIYIKNSSSLETPKKGEEESSSSSMYEEYKDATLDPNFKDGENGGVIVGKIEGERVQIISDNGISVGQINTEKLQNQESYSVDLINRLKGDVVTEMLGDDLEPTLRAEPTDGSAAGSIIAKNGGVRIENQAEGGKITLGDVKGTVVYMKAKGKVSMANVTATKNGDNTFESPAVKPLYIESEGDDVVISGNIEAVGGREIKSRTEKEQDKPKEAPKSQEEAKQVIEDVAGEKGIEEIDRTVNGNQENTDNSSNQEVSQVNDVSSLSDMGSDNIGGFEEMGSDAGGVDVGLSEGNAEFSLGADGSFEVASVGGAEETGSGADAGTASDGGMASNDGAMAEDNTASDEGAVANDNTDSDTVNGEGSNSESSAEEGNDEKGEETASVDSSEEENEENDKSGRPGKEKNGGNKKLTQFRSMLHQAKDSATQQRR